MRFLAALATVNAAGQLCRQNKVAPGWCTDDPAHHWKCWHWEPRLAEFDPVGPQPCEPGCVDDPPESCECDPAPGCLCYCEPAQACEPGCVS